jgi:hypothetical protein
VAFLFELGETKLGYVLAVGEVELRQTRSLASLIQLSGAIDISSTSSSAFGGVGAARLTAGVDGRARGETVEVKHHY